MYVLLLVTQSHLKQHIATSKPWNKAYVCACTQIKSCKSKTISFWHTLMFHPNMSVKLNIQCKNYMGSMWCWSLCSITTCCRLYTFGNCNALVVIIIYPDFNPLCWCCLLKTLRWLACAGWLWHWACCCMLEAVSLMWTTTNLHELYNRPWKGESAFYRI